MSEETHLINSWGEQTGSLERVLKALILDWNRLNERVDNLQKNHGPKIDAVKFGLDTLAANVQGFQTQEQAIGFQRRELALFRDSYASNTTVSTTEANRHEFAPATRLDKSPQQSLTGSLKECTKGALDVGRRSPSDAARARARQRWRWARMKIRLQMIRQRIPLTSVMIGRQSSIAIRLKQVEELVDSADYSIRFISKHAGPEKVKKLLKATSWLEEAFIGGPGQEIANNSGVLNRMLVVEQKCDAVCSLASIIDNRTEKLKSDFQVIREHLEVVAKNAECAFKDATHLRSKSEKADEAIRSALPRARREAVGLTRALRNTCFAAMRSRDIAVLPGSNRLMQGWLSPIYHKLEGMKQNLQLPLDPSAVLANDQQQSFDLRQWRRSALEMARYLFVKLRDDRRSQETAHLSTLKDVPIDIVGDQAYNIEKDTDIGFIIEVVDKITHARELATLCALARNIGPYLHMTPV